MSARARPWTSPGFGIDARELKVAARWSIASFAPRSHGGDRHCYAVATCSSKAKLRCCLPGLRAATTAARRARRRAACRHAAARHDVRRRWRPSAGRPHADGRQRAFSGAHGACAGAAPAAFRARSRRGASVSLPNDMRLVIISGNVDELILRSETKA